jgi:hypothetical protein
MVINKGIPFCSKKMMPLKAQGSSPYFIMAISRGMSQATFMLKTELLGSVLTTIDR